MNQPAAYAEWLQHRKQVVVPTHFVSSVMQSILLETTLPALHSRATARWSALMFAAGVLFVILCHAGTISLCLFALTGVAQ